MRQDKFAKFVVIFLIAVTVIVAGYLYLCPIISPNIPRPDLKATIKNTDPQEITLYGTIDNVSFYKVTKIRITACLIDEND